MKNSQLCADQMRMKILIIVFLILLGGELTRAGQIPENFKFQYYSNEGSVQLDCAHQALHIEPDFYQIVCGKGTNIRKNFEAKFRVRSLGSIDKPVYEVVYWVTDRNQSERYDHGSSMILNLTKGGIKDFSLHQEVENSYAALVVRFSGF